MFRFARMLATLLVGLIFVAGAPAMAQPAMWVIKDADSTIYLFGTVHILKPTTEWRSAKYDAALKSSEEIWLEINDQDDTAALQGLVQTLGMDAANPLSQRLSKADWEKFSDSLKKNNIPTAMVDPMKPWMAGIALSVVPMVKAGYDPTLGVDNVVKSDAQAASKPVLAFETTEKQLRFFDAMPEAAQVEFLMSTVKDMTESPAALDGMVVNWAKGDVKGLEDEMVTPMREDYPELYKVLLIDRNAAWAEILAKRLQGKGVSFVAVGSAHLIGPDSLQAQLAKKGIVAERF